jgi:hypothetical protein
MQPPASVQRIAAERPGKWGNCLSFADTAAPSDNLSNGYRVQGLFRMLEAVFPVAGAHPGLLAFNGVRKKRDGASASPARRRT